MIPHYAINKLDLSDVRIRNAYSALIDSSRSHLLDQPKDMIAIGASFGDHPIGIVLAEYKTQAQIAILNFIFVTEAHRNHHVATQILTKLESELKQKNIKLILFSYASNEPWAHILEHVIATLGWAPSRNFEIICHFDTDFNPPWLKQEYPLPLGFSIFPWKDLLPEQRSRLQHQQNFGLFVEELSPFKDEDKIEFLNSFGLEYKGEVVGWIITHRTAKDTIRYSSLFIQKRWQMSGVAIILLQMSIMKQKSSPIRHAILRVAFGDTEPSWLQFVKRRLVPYALKVEYTKQAWKALN